MAIHHQNEELYNKLKKGKIYKVTIIENHPMYEKHVNKEGYKTDIRYFDEKGIMTREDIEKEIYNLKRTTPGGSPISVLKVLDVCEITLTDEELKRYSTI